MTIDVAVEVQLGGAILNCDGTPLLTPQGVQLLNPSDWFDVTEDVMRSQAPVSAKRGITGSGPTDRVASPGTLSFSMDNGESNSAGLPGYYAPDHANHRSQFQEGTRVRMKFSKDGSSVYKWHGRISSALPTPGQFDARDTPVQARDYMGLLAVQKLNRIPVQTDKRTDQILALVVANLAIAPLNTDYDTGPEAFAYSLQDEQDEKTYGITVVQKAAQSDMGYVYVRGNPTDGETLVYENRQARQTNLTSHLTLDNNMLSLELKRGEENIYNDIRIPVTPTKVDDAATTILATNLNELMINPGETKTITMRFVDPSGAGRRISGMELVIPEANTDWKFSSHSGDNGNDMNGSLSVAYAPNGEGGNAADVTYTNIGGAAGYLQAGSTIRGKGVYQYDAQEAKAADADSQRRHGSRILTYSIPYQDNFNTAQDFTDVMLARGKDPFTDVTGASFYAGAEAELETAALNLDIGDRISLIENATGLSGDFFINSVQYDWLRTGDLKVTYGLERVLLYTPAGILDDPVFGLLDTSCYLSF